VGGVSGSSLPSARSRLSRKKVFARDLVATTSSKTEKLSGSVGGFSFHMQRTTVNVQRALKYMPETRSSSRDAEIIDLVDDDDGAGPSRRYHDFLHLLFVFNFLFSARLVLFLLLPPLLLLSAIRDSLQWNLLRSHHWMGFSPMTL
jgi:hypothetical protein